MLDHPPFQIHLEPENPIELPDLLRCLGAINHQFEVFATAEGLSSARDAKLLVSSVKPGSIDIGLLPDITTLGTLVAPVMVYSAPVLKFLTALKGLLDKFKSKTPADSVTIRDCSDAIAIAAPIAKSGGSQTFNSFNGEFYKPVFVLDQGASRDLIANAYATKALLEGEASEMRQRVPLVWHGLDTDQARSGGKRNPDKAVIEELDEKPRPVFFEDEFIGLKKTMIDNHDNPYKKVFFVDVHVSRVAGKIVSYRIVGHHGEADIEAE